MNKDNKKPTIEDEEARYQEVKEWAKQKEYISISSIQRECSVGFIRANRYLRRMQAEGLISEEVHKKDSPVLYKRID